MKTSTLQLVLSTIFLVFSSSCAVTDEETADEESEVFTRPKPEYPNSEFQSGREGWVVIDYSVGRGGVVEYIHVRESSGNSSFEDSARNAVQNWRYAPGEEKQLSVLMSFLSGRDSRTLSEEFFALYQQANDLIDEGELERAGELIAEARNEEDLRISELAYSFLTDGRIEGARGNRAEQLRLYRMAMLANGRWLTYENYLEALHIAVILELDQGDLATAVRDYTILTSTEAGRERGADLEVFVETAMAQIEADPSVMQPYVVADISMTVRPDQPPRHSRSKGPRNPAPYSTSAADNPRPRSQRSGPRSGSKSGSKKD